MNIPTGRMTAYRYKIGGETRTFYAHTRKEADEMSAAWANKRKLKATRTK